MVEDQSDQGKEQMSALHLSSSGRVRDSSQEINRLSLGTCLVLHCQVLDDDHSFVQEVNSLPTQPVSAPWFRG